jgi:ABC-2 type transport system permease protein
VTPDHIPTTTSALGPPVTGADPRPTADGTVPRPRDARVWDRTAAQVWLVTFLHHLRLLRTGAIAWTVGLGLTGVGVIATWEEAYPTQEARDRMQETVGGVPAFEALFGRTVELGTVEGFLLWRWGGVVVLMAAVWGSHSALKLRRGAEDAGHLELLRAGAISPRGLAAAALTAVGTTQVALAVVVGASHQLAGMDARTAWLYGVALAATAMTFAGVATLASELVDGRRRAGAIAWVVLGAAVGVRIVAASPGTAAWVWWASPIGWTSFLHASDGRGGTVLAAFAATITLLMAATVSLARRDLSSGWLARRQRDRGTAPAIRSVAAVSLRTAIGPTLAWAFGVGAGAFVFGLLADDFAAVVVDLPELQQLLAQLGFVGMDTPAGVVAMALGMLVVAVALQASTMAASIREEEASWRIEALLVRPVGRVRWLLTQVTVAAGAITVVALAAGAAAWAGTSVGGGELAAGDALASGVNLVPIGWLFLGIGVVVLGVAPRLTGPLAIGAVLVLSTLDLVGALLELPEWVVELSPFRHLAPVPAVGIALVPASIMVAVGAVGVVVGLGAFRRRDLRAA